jgi:hypothetical protein
MLPNLRATLVATIAALVLLMAAFSAVAMFRVAQESHGVLQADLAQRKLASLPPKPEQHAAVVIETPGPHLAPPPPLPVVDVKAAPVRAEVPDAPIVRPATVVADTPLPPATVEEHPPAPVVAEAPSSPAAPEPPMITATSHNRATTHPAPRPRPVGGPFAKPRPAPSEAERAAARAEHAAKLAAAKRAREVRLARQRRAARRAALARAKQLQAQQLANPFSAFGNGLNGSFGTATGSSGAMSTSAPASTLRRD